MQLTQLRKAQEQGIEVFSSFKEEDKPVEKKAKGKLTTKDFTQEAKDRVYLCPQGKPLTYRRQGHEKRVDGERVELERYQAEGRVCQACPEAARCTKNPAKGRIIKRLAEEELREACQKRSKSLLGELQRLARKSAVERVFGDWKEHRGQTRICGRSEAAAQSQRGLTMLYVNARSTFIRSLQ